MTVRLVSIPASQSRWNNVICAADLAIFDYSDRLLGLEFGKAVSVVEHQGEELSGGPVAGHVAFRFGDGAEEPAQVKLVGPDWDVDLISAEEGDGGAYAVYGWTVGEVAFEVESKPFLRASSNGDDDVLRTYAGETLKQSRVGYGSVTVHGRHVDGVFGDGDSLLFEPSQIALGADGTRHDPECVAGLTDIGFEKKRAEVLESGEALDGFRLQTVPDENHEGGVSDGEVCVEERVAIAEAAIEVFEGRSGGDNEKAAVAHDRDGGFGGAVEEVDAEDAVGLGWGCLSHAEAIFS